MYNVIQLNVLRCCHWEKPKNLFGGIWEKSSQKNNAQSLMDVPVNECGRLQNDEL